MKRTRDTSTVASTDTLPWKRIPLDDESWILLGSFPKELIQTLPPFRDMWNLHPKEFDSFLAFGKQTPLPRWQENYLQPYTFSRKIHPAKPIPHCFAQLVTFANGLLAPELFLPTYDFAQNKNEFNQAMANWYQSGLHYIGRHSDDESQLLLYSPIFSASFGETRTFRIRDKTTEEIVRNIAMLDGTFMIMCGKMQERFTHEVVKISGKKGQRVGDRINFTTRMFEQN